MAWLAHSYDTFPFCRRLFSYLDPSALPSRLAKIIPASYVFESLRSILTAGTFPGGLVVNLFIGALFAFTYLVAASRVSSTSTGKTWKAEP
jgi:hypothetical protein